MARSLKKGAFIDASLQKKVEAQNANNENKVIPIRNNSKVAVVSINKNRTGIFDKRLGDYMHVDSYSVNTSNSESDNALLDELSTKKYDVVIAGVFGLDQRPEKNYNITNQLVDFLNRLIKNNNTIVTWYGNPYSINKVNILEEAEGLKTYKILGDSICNDSTAYVFTQYSMGNGENSESRFKVVKEGEEWKIDPMSK